MGFDSSSGKLKEEPMIKKERPLCACGCGKFVKWSKAKGGWNRYLQHHHNRGRVMSPETCDQMGVPEGSRYPKFKRVSEKTRRKMSLSKRGRKSPYYRGASPYGRIWTPELKKLIRDRDDNKCQNPDCPDGERFVVLDIHHINYVKRDDRPENLITLCRKCNLRANFDKERQEKVYKEINSKKDHSIVRVENYPKLPDPPEDKVKKYDEALFHDPVNNSYGFYLCPENWKHYLRKKEEACVYCGVELIR